MKLREWLWVPILMVGFPVMLSFAFGTSIRSEMRMVKELKDDQLHILHEIEVLGKTMEALKDKVLTYTVLYSQEQMKTLIASEQTSLISLNQSVSRTIEEATQLQRIHHDLTNLTALTQPFSPSPSSDSPPSR